jgi:ribulose-phosphate 3-epimerase
MSHITILPSLPASDFASLKDLAEKIAPVATEIQIDIVDGQFVPALSWPFTEMLEEGNGFVETIAKVAELPSVLVREFDCMVSEPYQYLDALTALHPARVIIHHKSTIDYDVCVEHARTNNYKIGLAVLPSVALEEVAELIARFDYVQVMGIERVGSQGQPFAPQALTLIAELRATFPALEIAVDGAVNKETIPALIAAGANRLAPGSAIAKAADPAAAYLELVALSSHSL